MGPSYQPSGIWLGVETATAPYNTVSSFEWMQDDLHDYKSLGKTLNDIGGDLYQIKIKIEQDEPDSLILGRNGLGGARDAYYPAIANSDIGSDTFLAGKALTVLDYVQTGLENSTLSDAGVNTTLQSQLMAHLSLSDLDVHGANFVNAVLPTNPAVDLATTVAEFVSERGFFSVPGTSGSFAGEWLNVQLALTPFWSTLKDLRTTIEDQESLLEQYERDSGRLVRRRYEPDVDVESKVGAWSGHYNRKTLAFNAFYAGMNGSGECRYESRIKRWFAGAFTYALPEEGWRRKLSELDQLYGFTPGIDTAWELIPLSFVADYFANMGNVLGNLNAFSTDGLVMPYGYVMEQHKRSWHCTGLFTTSNPIAKYPVNFKLTLEVNRRRAANPFGFGFSDGDMSLRQWSILAALGITRGR